MTDGLSWLDRYFGGEAAAIVIPLSIAAVSQQSTFTRIGGASVDLSLYPDTSGARSRSIAFEADVQKSSGATSVAVQLVDVTNAATVTGTALTSTATDSTRVSSGELTVGEADGDIRDDIATEYEVQIKMNGGGATDAVFCVSARLVITYA